MAESVHADFQQAEVTEGIHIQAAGYPLALFAAEIGLGVAGEEAAEVGHGAIVTRETAFIVVEFQIGGEEGAQGGGIVGVEGREEGAVLTAHAIDQIGWTRGSDHRFWAGSFGGSLVQAISVESDSRRAKPSCDLLLRTRVNSIVWPMVLSQDLQRARAHQTLLCDPHHIEPCPYPVQGQLHYAITNAVPTSHQATGSIDQPDIRCYMLGQLNANMVGGRVGVEQEVLPQGFSVMVVDRSFAYRSTTSAVLPNTPPNPVTTNLPSGCTHTL